MALIDINTWIGHWPFRQLRHNSAQALVRRMDQRAIDRAVVAQIHGVFYKNVHMSNEELARETRRYRDRLIPFGTLNPLFPGWEEDLRRCAEDLELCGLRLYPQYHGYDLTDAASLELIDAAAELGWSLQVPMRIVDRRQRHPWDLARDLTQADLVPALKARPRVNWMFLNALGLDGKGLPRQSRFLVEISRMASVLQRDIQEMIETAGVEHLAFGTGMAFKVPEPALLKLEVLDTSRTVKDRIAWKNAALMLRLEDL